MIDNKPTSGNYTKAQTAYHDFQGLRELKSGAVNDDPEALKEVARQFEALFIQMILKSSREADELIGGEESLLRSKDMSFFQGMLDEQFSLAMTQSNQGKGLGLADVLVKQLAKSNKELPEEVNEATRREAQQLTNEVMQQLNNRRLRFSQQPIAKAPLIAAATNPNEQPKSLAIQGLPVKPNKQAAFDSPEEFVRQLYPIAEKIATQIGVDPKLMLAQTALETGWGKYLIQKPDGTSSFNLFNIKADKRWNGEAAEVQTLEFRNGRPQQERWPFRAYDSLEDSMQDYVNFLTANPRYEQALNKADNPQAFAKGLQQAGYATDPNYAHKILNIMDGNTLNQALDNLALPNSQGKQE